MKRTLITASIAAITTLSLAGPAAAAVTIDDNGNGFVGKGDVQLAFGLNNSELQRKAAGVTFSAAATATQKVNQTATQSAFQTSTEFYEQFVTCTTPNGNSGKFRTRSGERDGRATAQRTATRTATRTGSLTGTVSSSVAVEARSNKQKDITGFHLTGFPMGQPVYDFPSAAEFSSDFVFDEWSFDEFEYGEIKWINNHETNPCYLPGATDLHEGKPELVDTKTSPVHEQDVVVSETYEQPFRSGAWVVSATLDGVSKPLNS